MPRTGLCFSRTKARGYTKVTHARLIRPLRDALSSQNGVCEQRRPGPNEEDSLRQDQRAKAMDFERRAREDEDGAEQAAGGAVERKRAWQRMPAPLQSTKGRAPPTSRRRRCVR